MPKGEGKGWAKGRSAANDSRIARNAEAHRGRTYKRWLPSGEDRRLFARSARLLRAEWSDEMAYIVGLTATDGCLFTGLRKINFKSADRDLVVTYLRLLGRTNRVKEQKTRTGRIVYFTEFGDTELYRWFESIGLTPRKSLTLGAILVPDQFFFLLLRGLFDGDGCVQNFVHHPTRGTYPGYVYERLWLTFNSASHAHVDWIRETARRLTDVSGYLDARPATKGRRAFYRLRYGKHDSITLLTAMYPNDDVPRLVRKWRVWSDYRSRHATDDLK